MYVCVFVLTMMKQIELAEPSEQNDRSKKKYNADLRLWLASKGDRGQMLLYCILN